MRQIYQMKDGELRIFPYGDANSANAAFLRFKAEGLPLATENNGKVKFWIGDKEDFFEAAVRFEAHAYDWDSSDEFFLQVLGFWRSIGWWEEIEPHDCDARYKFKFAKKTYIVEEEFVREDDQLADMYGMKDKYYQYTFYENDKELSSYCCEA